MSKILKFSFVFFIFFFAFNFVSLNMPNNASISGSSSSQILTVAPQNLIAKAYVAGDVSSLTTMLNDSNLGNTAWLKKFYSFTRSLLNLALFAFLVYVAVRNILNLGVDNYGIKKLLPKIIVAAFLGNLVLPLTAFASRIVDSLQIVSIFQPRVFDWMSAIGNMPSVGAGIGAIVGIILLIFAPGVAGIAIGFGLLAFLVLGLMLVLCVLMSLFLAIRPWIIMLGVAIGPVAVACSVLPETESLFKKWLKIMGFWMVYPLLIYAITFLATKVPMMSGAIDDGAVSTIIAFILPLVIKIALFAMAVQAPFKWEKDIGGFLQGLPQTVVKGAQTFDKANRAVYGALGTRAYQSYRKRGQDAGDRNIKAKTADGTLATDVAAHMASAEGIEAQKRKQVDLLRTGMGKDDATMQLLGGTLPTFDKMLAKFDKFKSTGTLTDPNDAPILAYFRAHQGATETKAKELEEASAAADKRIDYGNQGEKAWRDNSVWAKTLMLTQESVPSGLSTYFKLFNEGFSSDMKKMEFRYNKPVQLYAQMTGGEVYLKDHKARKQGDHGPLDEEGLRRDVGDKDWYMAMVKGKQLGMDLNTKKGRDEALAYHLAQQRKYFDGQETGAVYVRQWLGRSETVPDIKNPDDRSKDVKKTIDADMLATNISAYEKQRSLSASAARSTVALEQQKFLRQNQQEKFWMLRQGAPSTGTSSAFNRAQSQLPISPAERKIIQGIEGLRKDIKGTSGMAALNKLNNSFGEISFDDLTQEEYANFYFDAKGDKHDLNDRLIDLAGNDSAKRDNVGRFMEALESSRGLEPKVLIDRARQEFGEDKEVERLISDYSAKSQMDIVITQKSPEARALQQKAATYAQRAAADSRVVIDTKKSIDIYYKKAAGESVTPADLEEAKKFIASQFGISDGNAVSENMVRELSKQVNVVSIRNPEVE